jgi:hypothetical protein
MGAVLQRRRTGRGRNRHAPEIFSPSAARPPTPARHKPENLAILPLGSAKLLRPRALFKALDEAL